MPPGADCVKNVFIPYLLWVVKEREQDDWVTETLLLFQGVNSWSVERLVQKHFSSLEGCALVFGLFFGYV